MISNKIDEMIASALKNRETELLNVLKLIKTEFVNALHNKSKRITLNDEIEIKILTKMANQREDSIRQYLDGNRQDLADKERRELEIIKNYLPQRPSDDEVNNFTNEIINNYVKENIKEGWKLSMKDMKPIMNLVHEKYPFADGKTISKCLQSAIKN